MVHRHQGDAVGKSNLTVCSRWGLSVADINRFDTPNLFFFRPDGVYIAAVSQPGNAANAGLVPGDIIISVNGEEILTSEDFIQAYNDALKLVFIRSKADIVILRNGQELRRIMDFATVFGQD